MNDNEAITSILDEALQSSEDALEKSLDNAHVLPAFEVALLEAFDNFKTSCREEGIPVKDVKRIERKLCKCREVFRYDIYKFMHKLTDEAIESFEDYRKEISDTMLDSLRAPRSNSAVNM